MRINERTLASGRGASWYARQLSCFPLDADGTASNECSQEMLCCGCTIVASHANTFCVVMVSCTLPPEKQARENFSLRDSYFSCDDIASRLLTARTFVPVFFSERGCACFSRILLTLFPQRLANGGPPSPQFENLEMSHEEPERPKPTAGTSAAQSSRRAKNAAHRADDVG